MYVAFININWFLLENTCLYIYCIYQYQNKIAIFKTRLCTSKFLCVGCDEVHQRHTLDTSFCVLAGSTDLSDESPAPSLPAQTLVQPRLSSSRAAAYRPHKSLGSFSRSDDLSKLKPTEPQVSDTLSALPQSDKGGGEKAGGGGEGEGGNCGVGGIGRPVPDTEVEDWEELVGTDNREAAPTHTANHDVSQQLQSDALVANGWAADGTAWKEWQRLNMGCIIVLLIRCLRPKLNAANKGFNIAGASLP